MPKLRSGEKWAKSLRQDIKTEIGLGFSVCGHKRSDGPGSQMSSSRFMATASRRSLFFSRSSFALDNLEDGGSQVIDV